MGFRLTRRRAHGSSSDATSAVLQLAVLLQAGVSPARAWEHLARTGDPAAARVSASLENRMPLPEAIAALEGPAWREVGVAWKVAATVGAPLAECLRGLAVALRDAQEAADDVRVALAEPAGTARLMGWLPLVAVGLGAALGFDTFGTLFTQPLGIACLIGGAALIFVAQRWSARLVDRARRARRVPGLEAELIAIALSGGVSIERARAVVAEAKAVSAVGGPSSESDARIPRAAAAAPRADASGEAGPRAAAPRDDDDADSDAVRERDEVDAVLGLSRTAGVPAVELLRASAAHARQRARIEGRLRAASLSSRLLLPLGVCTLPAFLLLGVAPMLLSVMSTMSVSL